MFDFGIKIIFVFLIFSCTSFCYEHPQTITITKEDIQNAQAKSSFDVRFSIKEEKIIKMLEKRHFNKTFENLSDEKRLKNLEYELLGRSWKFSPQESRIKTLKIASSNRILQGESLPPKISSKLTAKRLKSSIPMRQKDDVGLIDGFLRLILPEKYNEFQKHAEGVFENYDY